MRSWIAFLAVLSCVAPVVAQSSQRPRDFAEFRGTWIHDPDSSLGRIAALPVAKRLVITTTPTTFTIAKDSAEPEAYKIGAGDEQLRDERTGALLETTRRFTLVAGMVALTSTNTRAIAGGPAAAGTGTRTLTNIITDAYSVVGDTLTVERQLSVLAQPEGHLVTLANIANNRMTMVYRREKSTR